MKNIFLSAIITICFIVAAQNKSKAQVCNPDTSMNSLSVSAITPASLATATLNVAYSQTMQYHIVKDTTVNMLGFDVPLTINSLKIENISGLPTGLSYACHNANCMIDGGKTGCAKISGTPTQSGVFPLLVTLRLNATGTVLGNAFTIDTPQTNAVYSIIVNSNTATYEIVKSNYLGLTAFPNPASDKVQLNIQHDKNTSTDFFVFDTQGKVVYSNSLGILAGTTKVDIDVSAFEQGLYFIKLNSGEKQVVTKFVVSR